MELQNLIFFSVCHETFSMFSFEFLYSLFWIFSLLSTTRFRCAVFSSKFIGTLEKRQKTCSRVRSVFNIVKNDFIACFIIFRTRFFILRPVEYPFEITLNFDPNRIGEFDRRVLAIFRRITSKLTRFFECSLNFISFDTLFNSLEKSSMKSKSDAQAEKEGRNDDLRAISTEYRIHTTLMLFLKNTFILCSSAA